MYSDYSESGSFKQKKFGYVDSDNNSHINSEINANDEEFKEFLDYILINIEKYETKIKEAYENIQNSFENPENLGVLTNKFDFYIEREYKFLDKINNLKSKIEYMRERKKDLKLEFNNLIKDYEHKKFRLNELEQENVNMINENLHLKSEINEMKEQMSKSEKSEDTPASVNHIDLHAIIYEKQIIINEKNNLKKRIEDYETQLNAVTHRNKEDHQKIISLEIEKRNLHYKNKTLEMKMNTILKEIEEMRRINENLNNENLNLRNEMTSNLENQNDENKRANPNNGLNLHTFLDEQYVKQNSNILNMREIFKKCNTLKKKFSQKCTTLNSYINQKALKNISRDHSAGSRNSNISAIVIDNKQKNSTSELNGVSRSHIPLPLRKIANLKRTYTTRDNRSNHVESSNNENKEVLNLQKTINNINLSFNNNINTNNDDELNNLKEYSNNYNCLTLGNIGNSPREKSEEKKIRKHSNLVLKNNKSEANKSLVNANSIFEDKDKNKFLENRRQSSKTNKSVNGRVSFSFIEENKPNTFLKEDDMVSKIKRYTNRKNSNPNLNAGHYDLHDYKNFFYLSYESIKHNTTKTHIFEDIDVDNLYKYALIHSIPFYKYNKYIKSEIKGMLGKYQEDETKTEKVVNSVMNFFEIFLNMK